MCARASRFCRKKNIYIITFPLFFAFYFLSSFKDHSQKKKTVEKEKSPETHASQ